MVKALTGLLRGIVTLYEIVDGGKIFTNGVLNVRKRFSFGVTLGPATG